MTALAINDASRESLVERLFRAFAKQLDDIEERVSVHHADDILDDAKVLSGLAKTLETLVTVERRLTNTTESAPLDIEALRTELAERLSGLRVMAEAGEKTPDPDEVES